MSVKTIWLLSLFLLINGASIFFITVILQPQQAKAVTYINTPGGSVTDTCDRVRVSVSETPSCSRLTTDTGNACVVNDSSDTNPVSSYTMRLTISSNDGQPHQVTYVAATNFCTSGYLRASGGYCSCVDNENQTGLVTVSVNNGTSQTVNLTRSSPYGACGSYQHDFGIIAVDNNILCNYRDQGGFSFAGASGGCETGISCSAPTTYTVDGGLYIDLNKNGNKDSNESYYQDTGSFTASSGNMSSAPFGTYLLSGIGAGNVTVSFTPPPGYKVVAPLNGPPPSYQVRVGPGCTTGGASGATCLNGSVRNLNFAISNSVPWIQTYGLDARFDSGYTNAVPVSPVYPKYASVTDTSSSTPGIVYAGDSAPSFGQGQASSTNWVVGGSVYPEVDGRSQTELAYDYLLNKATRANVTTTSLTSVIGCSNLSNCTLPANLPNGVYTANGDVTLHAFTAQANRNYVFLINGTLTIDGRIIVPTTSVAFFSANTDISIARTVAAAANAAPLPAGQLQGIFSADRNIIVQGTTDCATAVDKMLNVEGAFVVNADGTGGRLLNNRDLCSDNPSYPSLTLRERLDFLLNMPSFLMKQSTTFSEGI